MSEIATEEDIKGAFGSDKGHAKVTLKFDKDSFSPNETINIMANIDNTQCKKDLDKIVINLIRNIRAKHGEKYFLDE